ncbi:MAG: glycosyltransferase [Anaerolineae bacterium]|nr:glycosyltransferase [Anaerolineae bacterium]
MKLLIVSHTPHYRVENQIVGWGPTVREINYLTCFFDEIIHVATLHDELAPASALPYKSTRVHVEAILPSGGNNVKDKMEILRVMPQYAQVISKYLRWADIVHVRCPANIALLALFLLLFKVRPVYRWFKYAGNWKPQSRDAYTYRLQRWLLSQNLARGVTTINGYWAKQPPHIFTFLNPCLTNEELIEAGQISHDKRLSDPLRLLFVGRTEQAKGLDVALRVVTNLREQNVPFVFDIVGDGSERPYYEKIVAGLGLTETVRFHGWVSRDEVNQYYRLTHFLLFPSVSEGWPKVLSEAMAYGVVPIASHVSSIPQVLRALGCGVTVPQQDDLAFAEAITAYRANPERWQYEAQAGQESAEQFTYERYARELKKVFQATWGIPILEHK